jgi:pimeloyl-ACP methyl ester carboxylesterase
LVAAFCVSTACASIACIANARSVVDSELDLSVRVLGVSGPWVVFESGLGAGMNDWAKVAPMLAACTRVVLYDRLGIGTSPPLDDNGPVVASAVAGRLARLLRTINATPPYILVGHSLAGLYVQSFARLYPQYVAGVVLVDAVSPLEPPGVFQSTVPPPPGSTAAAEEAGVAPSVDALLSGPSFPAVPLIVLAAASHNDTEEREALWRSIQKRTASLSPLGHMEVVKGSGHFIQNDSPQAVVRAVLRLAQSGGADITRCLAN